MSTTANLQEAFAGESQANRKYLAFAKRAEQDGFPQVAKLFRAAADAETVHAHAHLRVLQGVKSTEENLQAAVDGEGHEFKEMYPGFVTEAHAHFMEAAEQVVVILIDHMQPVTRVIIVDLDVFTDDTSSEVIDYDDPSVQTALGDKVALDNHLRIRIEEDSSTRHDCKRNTGRYR